MKFFRSLLILVVANSIANSQSYDGELRGYHSGRNQNFEHLVARAESISQTKFEERSIEQIALRSAARKYFSLTIREGRSYLGLFVVNEFDENAYPFVRLFTDKDIRTESIVPLNGSFGQELTLLKCDVLELFDAKVSNANLASIAIVESLKVLGLPARGFGFDEYTIFPASLETLIVRNAYLNDHFFQAISKLKKLKTMVLINCGISYESPVDAGISYSSNTWNDYPRLFRKSSGIIESLKILNSDPAIFNHVVREQWPNLKDINVVLQFDNARAIHYITSDQYGEFQGVIKCFPALKLFSFKEHGYEHPRLRENFNAIKITRDKNSQKPTCGLPKPRSTDAKGQQQR